MTIFGHTFQLCCLSVHPVVACLLISFWFPPKEILGYLTDTDLFLNYVVVRKHILHDLFPLLLNILCILEKCIFHSYLGYHLSPCNSCQLYLYWILPKSIKCWREELIALTVIMKLSVSPFHFVNFYFIYSWPLTNTGLNSVGPLILEFFFSNYIVQYHMICGWLNPQMQIRALSANSKAIRRFRIALCQSPQPLHCSRDHCILKLYY